LKIRKEFDPMMILKRFTAAAALLALVAAIGCSDDEGPADDNTGGNEDGIVNVRDGAWRQTVSIATSGEGFLCDLFALFDTTFVETGPLCELDLFEYSGGDCDVRLAEGGLSFSCTDIDTSDGCRTRTTSTGLATFTNTTFEILLVGIIEDDTIGPSPCEGGSCTITIRSNGEWLSSEGSCPGASTAGRIHRWGLPFSPR
jgi:hypothetical protein